jgi:hypothetical protein
LELTQSSPAHWKSGLADRDRVPQGLSVTQYIIETLLAGPDDDRAHGMFAVEIDDFAVRPRLGVWQRRSGDEPGDK